MLKRSTIYFNRAKESSRKGDTMKGIYILTCRTTGLSYVGQSINIKKRLTEHFTKKTKQVISQAIAKYGKNDFTVESIHYPNVSKKALNAIEKWYIAKLGTYTHGYNTTVGGDTNPMDDPVIRKRHKVISGAKTAEMNMLAENRERSQKRCIQRNKSPEHRAKVSKVTSDFNKKRWEDPEYRKQMSGDNNPSRREKRKREEEYYKLQLRLPFFD